MEWLDYSEEVHQSRRLRVWSDMIGCGFKMIMNYRVIVERYPFPNGVVRLQWRSSLVKTFKGMERYDWLWVQDDFEHPGDSGEVSISEWSGWRFDSRYESFSLLDGKN